MTRVVDTEAQSPANYLRQLIQDRSLRPGDRLPSIRQLAEQLQISRVAARDLLVQAEVAGLAEIHPRSGAVVSRNYRTGEHEHNSVSKQSFSMKVVDGHQLYLCQARRVIEVELAGLAAERCRPEHLLPIRQALVTWLESRAEDDEQAYLNADSRFHLGIAKMAGNPVLTAVLEQCLRQQLMWECAVPETEPDRQNMETIHQEIYDALSRRDSQLARAAMTRHMQQLECNIQTMLLDVPGIDQPSPLKSNGEVGQDAPQEVTL